MPWEVHTSPSYTHGQPGLPGNETRKDTASLFWDRALYPTAGGRRAREPWQQLGDLFCSCLHLTSPRGFR